MPKSPIVLIHGLWMTPRSFEAWINQYEQAGHEVHAPSWPGMEADVEDLRRDPTPIARLTVKQIVDHYERFIRDLSAPPIIMGHSFGGAFTQVLLDRGLGAAGVAIDSAAVRGVNRLPFSTLRTAWPVLRNPRNRHRAVSIGVKQFRYRFTNHLSVAESRPIYDRYCVPGAGHVLFEGAMANFNRRSAIRVDFRNTRRAPLLFVAGGIDHVSPPSINRSNAKQYRKSEAVTDLKVFPGRAHFILGQAGWEEIADFALGWALDHVGAVRRFDAPAA